MIGRRPRSTGRYLFAPIRRRARCRLCCRLGRHPVPPDFAREPLAEATLTIAFAYVIFIVCDHYVGVSGVVAVASAALAVSAGGRRRLAPSNWENLVVTWEQLAFWASSLIFLFAAMQTPELLERRAGPISACSRPVVAALVARAMTLYGLIPMLSFAGIAKPIDRDHKLVMLWGGMRGAVSLALALAATENTALPAEVRQFVGILATGFVLFTLLVTAPTMRPLMRLLKMSSLPPAEVALSQRVIGLSLSSIHKDRDVGRQHQISPEIVAEVATIYGRAAEPRDIAEENAQLPAELRDPAALSVLADREQEFCLDYFESRTVSRRVAAACSLMPRGCGTARAATVSRVTRRRPLGFVVSTRFCVWRWRSITGSASPARSPRLSDRFEVQLAARFVLQNVIAFNRDQIEHVFGSGPSAVMAQQLDLRFGRDRSRDRRAEAAISDLCASARNPVPGPHRGAAGRGALSAVARRIDHQPGCVRRFAAQAAAAAAVRSRRALSISA